MPDKKLTYYFERYALGQLNKDELSFFTSMLKNPVNKELVQQILDRDWPMWEKNELDFSAEIARIEQGVASAIMTENSVAPRRLTHRIHFLRRWTWAAAVLVLLSTGAYLYTVSKRTEKPLLSDNKQLQKDIQPGTNRAVLTVDNQQIDLASDKTGITVGETITYANGETISDAGKMLMLTTPNGGQYQLVLPDGTKAWLNAASGISFPSAFSAEKREIKVTGEVYLEVAKDKARPFLVNVDGKSIVEVLGTSFNINSYAGEENIKTTLIDGSIRVSPGNSTAVATSSDRQLNSHRSSSVILKPGQQAVLPLYPNAGNTLVESSSTSKSEQQSKTQAEGLIPDVQFKIINTVDLSQTLAWKNGLFNFNGLRVREVLNQLARWYDIKVRIQGKEPEFRFMGEMYRSANLSEVLKMLQKMDVKFRMEGNILIVL